MMKEIFLDINKRIKIAINHYSCARRKTVLIICPGCFMCKDAQAFQEMSESFFKYYNVITMDFRGHGRSTGFFTFTANESADLRAVLNFAKKRYSRILILGFSLGAATAIIEVARRKDIQGMILASAATDFEKIENHFLAKEAIISAIERFDLGKNPFMRPGNVFLKKVKPLNVVQRISPIPIGFIAGAQDPITFPWHTETLYQKAKTPKFIKIFKNGLHAEDLYLKSKKRFMKICKNWFDKMLKNKRNMTRKS